MKRRAVLTLAGGVVVATTARPVSSQTARVAHVGQLGNRPASEPNTAAFHGQITALMKSMGWEIGQNLFWNYKSGATSLEQQLANARELLAQKVDVVLASNSEATAAAFQLTRTVPIVMVGGAAVELGYAKSLARPGGNVTGYVYQSLDFHGKEVELLLALRPDLKRLGWCGSTELPEMAMKLGDWKNVAAARGVTVVALPDVLVMADIEIMLAAAERQHVQALVIGGVRYFLVGAGLQRIQEWATANKVLTYAGTWHPGQLLAAFGPDGREIIPTVCRQIDRILRGERPADIPIEQPTRFRLIVNQRIARALGISIPPSLLLRADEVIQ